MKSIKLTTLLAAFAAAFITTSHAETKTWDGGANTTAWGDANNWNPDGVPGQADSVEIKDAEVTCSGDLIVSNLTLTGSATVSAGGELKSTDIALNPIYYGGKVSCALIALISTPITLSDAEIYSKSTFHKNGIYGGGNNQKYLNFVDGESRAAKYTYQTTWNPNSKDTYVNFFQGNNAYIRYNDNAIDIDTFNENFENVDNGDGTSTILMKTRDGWGLGSLTVGDVEVSQVAVSVIATKYSGDAATVYFVQGARDYGETFSSWPTATDGVAVSATGEVSDTLTLEEGYNYIRAFLLYDGEYTASAVAIRHKVAPPADYGDLTDVYEYIGEDNNLSAAANWWKDGQATESVPVAGVDTRWFGKNARLSISGFNIYSTDIFNGADITSTGTGDSHFYGSVVLTNTTLNVYVFVYGEEKPTISLYGSRLTTRRIDAGQAGFYNPMGPKAVNFLGGAASSFTFGKVPSLDTESEVFTDLVSTGKIVFNGENISENDWNTFFTVDILDNTVTITYDPSVDENKIASVESSDVESTSAVLSATIASIADGATVIVACDIDEITEANIVAKGETVAVNEGVATKSITSLISGNIYNYAFAIVQDNVVKAFKSGLFFTSDFDYVYMNGAWQGADPGNLNVGGSVLILDDYSNGQTDLQVKGTVVSNAAITSTGTLVGSGTMQVYSSQIANTKLGDGGAVCGTYNGSTFMNFVSLSENGVVYPACSYTFNAKEEWKNDAYSLLFDAGRIHLNGAKVDQATYESNFTLVQNRETGNEITPYNLTLTYWEPFPTAAQRIDWTVQPGARIKLSSNTRIGALNIPDAADVKINLNGFKLVVSALTIGGETMKGEYTATDLGVLIGEGSLAVSGRGLAIVIR